jgi:hypothetical protein
MSQPLKSREFAQCLIALDARSAAPKSTVPAFQTCARLRPQLAVLMGNAGFTALVGRALSLASAEAQWLEKVHVQPDGTLEAPATSEIPVEPEQLAEGGGALIIQLLGLLVEFIGEDLTVHLVEQTWPELSDRHSGNGVKHENGA